MAYKTLLYNKEAGIGFVTVNRPDVLNALNSEVFHDLISVFDEITHDNEVRVVIVTGSGDRAFVAGADIAQMQPLTAAEARSFTGLGKRAMDKIENLSKPVIAAVNGFALGGGCELAMVCDLRIASEKARFGQPEINLGIIPGSGGTQRLTRLIGATKAKELIYTGDMIDAQTALDLGLVNKVVPAEELIEEAKKMAQKLLSKGSFALAMAKTAVNRGSEVDLNTATYYEIECFAQCFATEDQKEGMAAFIEKRPPNFKGR